jgi:hypothetical protein
MSDLLCKLFKPTLSDQIPGAQECWRPHRRRYPNHPCRPKSSRRGYPATRRRPNFTRLGHSDTRGGCLDTPAGISATRCRRKCRRRECPDTRRRLKSSRRWHSGTQRGYAVTRCRLGFNRRRYAARSNLIRIGPRARPETVPRTPLSAHFPWLPPELLPEFARIQQRAKRQAVVSVRDAEANRLV